MAGQPAHQEREPSIEEELTAVWVDGGPTRLTGPVLVVDYDSEWPRLYRREVDRITAMLAERALLVEHVGSTAVPGLAAKPIIDIDLVVVDAADEAAYVPALEAAGYRLVLREPDWHQHRLLRGPDTDVNVHVFSEGCPEVERNVAFRNWLRADDADRDLYARTKRELAGRPWTYLQQYADAKTPIVTEILQRAASGQR